MWSFSSAKLASPDHTQTIILILATKVWESPTMILHDINEQKVCGSYLTLMKPDNCTESDIAKFIEVIYETNIIQKITLTGKRPQHLK